METVSAYGSPKSPQPAALLQDQSGSDSGQHGVGLTQYAAPFVTQPRPGTGSPGSAAGNVPAGVDRLSNAPAPDESPSQAELDTSQRKCQPALDVSGESVTANLSDVCSDDAAVDVNPGLCQSSAMIRGGEVLGSLDGVLPMLLQV